MTTTPNLDLIIGFASSHGMLDDDAVPLAQVRGYGRMEHGREEYVGPSVRDLDRMNWWREVRPKAVRAEGYYHSPRSGEVTVNRVDNSDGPIGEQVGRLEKRGLRWYGVHADGTETGGAIHKDGAVKALVDYHNGMASQLKADPEKIADLERSVKELDPLYQMEKEQFRKRLAGIVPEGSDPDEHWHLLNEDALEGGAGASEHARGQIAAMRSAGYMTRSERFREEQGAKIRDAKYVAGLTSPLAQVLSLAQVNVKGFEREVRGREEFVRPFSEARKDAAQAWPHPPAVGGHQVLGVYTHPASQHALYDLGHGLHAEGKPGGKPGPVLRSTGLDQGALKTKGWSYLKPPAAARGGRPAPGARAVAKPAGPAGGKGDLAKVTGAARGRTGASARPSLPWTRKPGGKVEYKDNLGISRSRMPQVSGVNGEGKYVSDAENGPKFEAQLKDKGIKVTSDRVPAWSLRPTQAEGDQKTIRGIADALKSGELADTKPITISSDNRVIDGHHTWAGRALADSEGGHPGLKEGLPVRRVHAPAAQVMDEMRKFQAAQGMKSRKVGEAANPDFKSAVGAGAPSHGGKLSDSEYHAYADKLDEALTTAAAQKLTTEHTHSPDGGKSWDPDRAKVHDEIVDQLMKKYENVPREGKAIIAGGLGGAGKSTVLKKDPAVAAGHYATVNPDDIKEELAKRGLVPDLPGMPEANPMERTGLVHEESSHVAGLLARRLLAQKTNVVHDITMSSPGSVQKRIDALHGAGYQHIHGMFVHIPVEKSVESARSRHRQGLDDFWSGKSKLGERFVPSGVIRASARLDGSNANRSAFEELKPKFNSWDLWDRSDMGDAKLVGSGGKKR